MSQAKDVVEGVAEAWAGWLCGHDVTTVDAIEDGIERAVKKWMDTHHFEIVEAIAEAIAKRSEG